MPRTPSTGKNKETKDLTQKAYLSIRQMLFYNEIMPGQKIKYKDLAGRIGVSMTPVIQALKWLEFRNIVRHEPNRGYYVNEVSLKEIKEVYDTRLLIETSLAAKSVTRLDDTGMERIQSAFFAYRDAVSEDKYHKRILMDMEFHMCLASLSDAQIQLKMLQELFDVLLLRYSRNLFFLSVMDTSLQEHEDILTSLERRDADGLTRALSTHIETVQTHILKGMRRIMDEDRESLSDRYLF
ncbi:MAG TPA: GntR family transcriptional regulator [Desulfobacteraceae bacterium]|nr:GntR family transcriptional regulator [Desulfobacteraceae bacterium]